MYQLFIDESGKNTLKSQENWPPHFSIGGTLIHDQSSEFIKRRGDQIKFKYWGHTKVTFRGNNIRRLDGDFAIFQDVIDPISGSIIQDRSQIRDNFYSDFLQYIQSSNFKFICVCINKNDWIKKNQVLLHAVAQKWQVTGFEKQLTKDIFEEVVKIYMCYLRKKDAEGKIVVEASDISQDGDILAIYNRFMFEGIPSMGMDTAAIRNKLTCISFATKNNRDHETQLADIGSHFLSIKARQEDNVTYNKPITEFEKRVISIFETKSFKDNCHALGERSIRRL